MTHSVQPVTPTFAGGTAHPDRGESTVHDVYRSAFADLGDEGQRNLRDRLPESSRAARPPTKDFARQVLDAAVDAGTSEVAWFTALRSRLGAAMDGRTTERNGSGRKTVVRHRDLVRQYVDFDTLMGGYLNLDWRVHWSTVDEVYRSAFADFGDEGRRDLRLEVGHILDAYRTDDEVRGLLQTMRIGFNPERRLGLTPRAWLEDLRDRLTA